MKKEFLVFWVVALAAGLRCPAVRAQNLEWQEISQGKSGVNSVVIAGENPKLIYFGGEGGVFRSQDNGASSRNILSLGGKNKAVRQLLFSSGNTNQIFAAAENGLYASFDQGSRWKRVYQGRNYLEGSCQAIAQVPWGIYLGTSEGLFLSRDLGVTWHKEKSPIGGRKILSLAYHNKEPHSLLVVCPDAVFKTSDCGRRWEKIFSARLKGQDEQAEEEAPEEPESSRSFSLRGISISQEDPREVFVAASQGVYASHDGGARWEELPTDGLPASEIQQVLSASGYGLLAMTSSGLYVLHQNQWQELSRGLGKEGLRAITIDTAKNIYLGGESGLWRAQLASGDTLETSPTLSQYLAHEPDIRQVQEIAIKYADTQPEKIFAWRKSSAQAAWLPEVSAGLNRDTGDLWHWEGGSTSKAGDDTLIRGRDCLAWDISLSWDLGELIWNSDQTAIDVRSRLMVEQRGEILDEVTKLYFERIRTKMDLDRLRIEDTNKRLEKEVKLKELTAYLDALTGGYFSRSCQTPGAS